MRWALAAVLLCATLAGAPVGAAAQSSSVLSDARLEPVRDRLTQSLDAAHRDGLPSEWLLDKVAEGLSKHVPPGRIVAAVDTLLSRMRAADALIREVPGARGAEHRRLLRAALDALTAGAPHEGLGRLVREVVRSDRAEAPRRVHEALTTVAELAERQFGGHAAVDATTEAYQHGRRGGLSDLLRQARRIGPGPARDDALRNLGRRVGRAESDVDHGGRGSDHRPDVPPARGLR